MKKLKWYNYAAKVILIALFLPCAPLFILVSLAMGGSPLDFYKIIWETEDN